MIKPTPEPYNVEEKYLHGINIRLEILIEQMSSLLEHIAKRDAVATINSVVEEKLTPQSIKKKAK